MRFNTKFLLSLLSASSAFAVHITYKGECETEYESFSECDFVNDVTEENFRSERCQNFYKNSLEYLPHCKEQFSDYETSIYEANVKLNLAKGLLKFSLDENNKKCSFTKFRYPEIDESDVKDICKSKKCSETAIQAYTLLAESDVESYFRRILPTYIYEEVVVALERCSNGMDIGEYINFDDLTLEMLDNRETGFKYEGKAKAILEENKKEENEKAAKKVRRCIVKESN